MSNDVTDQAIADKLLALADRCEATPGPDRGLDAAIAHAIAWRWDDWEDGDLRIEERPLEWLIDRVGNSNSIWCHLPRYTGSLDAAMALAQEDWWFNTSAPLSPAAYGYSREDMRQPRAGFEMIGAPYSCGARAASMALATCAAALRARAGVLTTQNTGE